MIFYQKETEKIELVSRPDEVETAVAKRECADLSSESRLALAFSSSETRALSSELSRSRPALESLAEASSLIKLDTLASRSADRSEASFLWERSN